MIVDVCTAWDFLIGFKEKPYVVLRVGQTEVEFLCDTGACNTVLKTPIPDLRASHNTIWVKSADGQTHKEYISRPTTIKDIETGVTISASVVISPKCPINLLGRDLMTRLGIAIIPVKDGMRAYRLKNVDSYVLQKDRQVYCSYDVISMKNPHVPSQLLQEAKKQLAYPEAEMSYNQLHVTMNILMDPQDDYIESFLKNTPVTLTVTNMYTDRRSFAAVTVLLPPTQNSEYKLFAVPHISLFKPNNITWADVGCRTKVASAALDYVDKGDGWSYSASCDVWKQERCDVITGEAGVHLLS